MGLPEIPGGFHLHLEGNLQWRRVGGVDPGKGRNEHRPAALYADLGWTGGPLSLTVELKDYYDFQPLEGAVDPFTGLDPSASIATLTQWEAARRYLPSLVRASVVTLVLSCLSMALAVAIGVVIATGPDVCVTNDANNSIAAGTPHPGFDELTDRATQRQVPID